MDDDLSPDHCRTSGQSDCELKAIITWDPTLEGNCRNWANEESVGTLSPSAVAKSRNEGSHTEEERKQGRASLQDRGLLTTTEEIIIRSQEDIASQFKMQH